MTYTPRGRGIPSPFEPAWMDLERPVISTQYPKAQGRVGGTLGKSKLIMSNAGLKGEVNFHKALSMVCYSTGRLLEEEDRTTASILARYNTFWGLRNLVSGSQGDVDCGILTGNRLILVDVKFIKSGNVRYVTCGRTFDTICNETGNSLNKKPIPMSENMAKSTENYTRLFPELRILSGVVLVPTDYGETPNLGKQLVWPGGVNSTTMGTFLANIVKNTAPIEPNEEVAARLTSCLKS